MPHFHKYFAKRSGVERFTPTFMEACHVLHKGWTVPIRYRGISSDARGDRLRLYARADRPLRSHARSLALGLGATHRRSRAAVSARL